MCFFPDDELRFLVVESMSLDEFSDWSEEGSTITLHHTRPELWKFCRKGVDMLGCGG